MTLEMAGPDPLRTRTALRLTLPEASDVTVDVFDVSGRRVTQLAQGARGAGESRLDVDASALPAGRYVVRASAGGQTATRALTVVR